MYHVVIFVIEWIWFQHRFWCALWYSQIKIQFSPRLGPKKEPEFDFNVVFCGKLRIWQFDENWGSCSCSQWVANLWSAPLRPTRSGMWRHFSSPLPDLARQIDASAATQSNVKFVLEVLLARLKYLLVLGCLGGKGTEAAIANIFHRLC